MAQFEIPITKVGKQKIGQSSDSVAAESAAPKDGDAKRVAISTMGCKVNTYESELIAQTLKTQNWTTVAQTEQADLYLINTCTVTREADRQARQIVRKAVRRNPDALVVVTGCYAQMDPQACADIPGVDLVLGNDKKLDAHALIPQLEQGELPKVMVGDLDQQVSLPDQILAGFEAHTRAFVQIQQGCDQGCTFCIIHVARGPSRSLAPSLIKRQVQRLVLNGYPEIVICGVDLGSYGDDFDSEQQFGLVELLKELLALEYDQSNPFRIRLSSIDPAHISDELIELMSNEPRLCAHIHLSLQSGSTLILKRMKRRYDADHVRERIAALRAKLPQLVLSADVMVGFPTETEELYLETEQMVKDIKVAYPHTFSYSERDGTPAARIPQAKAVPVAERKARNQRLRAVGKSIEQAMQEQQLGRELWVLPESEFAQNKDYTLCRSEAYVPVLVKSEQVEQGRWLQVKVSHLEDGFLYGE